MNKKVKALLEAMLFNANKKGELSLHFGVFCKLIRISEDIIPVLKDQGLVSGVAKQTKTIYYKEVTDEVVKKVVLAYQHPKQSDKIPTKDETLPASFTQELQKMENRISKKLAQKIETEIENLGEYLQSEIFEESKDNLIYIRDNGNYIQFIAALLINLMKEMGVGFEDTLADFLKSNQSEFFKNLINPGN